IRTWGHYERDKVWSEMKAMEETNEYRRFERSEQSEDRRQQLYQHFLHEVKKIMETELDSWVKEFFQSPWWNRIWTLQEIALAKHAVLLYGDAYISWDNVQQAAEVWR